MCPWLQGSFVFLLLLMRDRETLDFQYEAGNVRRNISGKYCFQLQDPTKESYLLVHVFIVFSVVWKKSLIFHKNEQERQPGTCFDRNIKNAALHVSMGPLCLAWSASFRGFERWHHAFHYAYHPLHTLSHALHILCSPSTWAII